MSTRAHTVPRFYLSGFTAKPSSSKHEPYVYVGKISTGVVKRRAPKNLSILKGLYDGVGGFAEDDASVEDHLAKIESAAAPAIRQLSLQSSNGQIESVPPEVWRFVTWQAARTPGFMSLEADWASNWNPNEKPEIVEPPPDGLESIEERPRPLLLELPATGETREAAGIESSSRSLTRVGVGNSGAKTI